MSVEIPECPTCKLPLRRGARFEFEMPEPDLMEFSKEPSRWLRISFGGAGFYVFMPNALIRKLAKDWTETFGTPENPKDPPAPGWAEAL